MVRKKKKSARERINVINVLAAADPGVGGRGQPPLPTVRGPCEDHNKDRAKVVSNVEVHEVVKAGDHVKPFGAREMAKMVRAPACNSEKLVVNPADKMQDHKCTWRDVLMNGIVKKNA